MLLLEACLTFIAHLSRGLQHHKNRRDVPMGAGPSIAFMAYQCLELSRESAYLYVFSFLSPSNNVKIIESINYFLLFE